MSKEYGAESISILKGLDAVKQRPGMYVGDVTSVDATHHLLYEIFDNSVDEALAGHADRVDVILHDDGSASVRDNGRGIPVGLHPEAGVSAAEVVLTTLHAGGKFDSDSYKFSGGLHGVGSACTNALSDYLMLEVKRDGKLWAGLFEEGETKESVSPVRDLKRGEEKGTWIRFRPSEKYLKDTHFQRDVLLKRFREVAFLNKNITISFVDERGGEPYEEICSFSDGIMDFVRVIAGESDFVAPVLSFSGEHNGSEVEAAFGWMVEDKPEDIRAYANNIPQSDGGQHLTGLKGVITKVLFSYAERNKLIKRSNPVTADDLREGIAGVVHVRLSDPAFSSQTKEKLISTEARAAVEGVVGPQFEKWLDENPNEAKTIFVRAQNAAEAREAAKRARELSRTKTTRKRVSSVSLPTKLADCSSKTPEDRELFLVEGDSAGGSAKQGRDRETQAILPLRGKILNVEKAKVSKILQNAEVAAMIQTLGAGMGDKMDLSGLRYHKVVIMTDADVDGAHIATLILTFFFRQMKPFVEAGHLYLAVPPLYRIRRKGEEDLFVNSDREMTRIFVNKAVSGGNLIVDGERMDHAGMVEALSDMISANSLLGDAQRIIGNQALAEAVCSCDDLIDMRSSSESRGNRIAKHIKKVVEATDKEADWEISFSWDEGPHIRAKREEDGVVETFEISPDDLKTRQIRTVMDAYRKSELHKTEATIKDKRVYGPFSLMNELRESGARGAVISRYKGLGEMNPQELWDTTMNPQTRWLHRVSVNDAKEADRIMSELMADNVSARKALIEEMFSNQSEVEQ